MRQVLPSVMVAVNPAEMPVVFDKNTVLGLVCGDLAQTPFPQREQGSFREGKEEGHAGKTQQQNQFIYHCMLMEPS